MDFDDPRQRPVFFDVHHALPREGPGNRASARRALELVGPLPSPARILDVGCGPGLQTVELAEMVPEAQIIAVDNHQPFLDELDRRASRRGVGERITTRAGDMTRLDFPAASFDLVWCEAAVYVMGFPQALAAWRPLLRPGGRMAVSEVVWLRSDRPAAVEELWQREYPAITDVAGCRALIRDAGDELIGDFVLPEEAWLENYYTPMEVRLASLRRKYAGDPVAEGVLRECREEIDFYRRYKSFYGYAFFVLARAVD